VTVLDRDASFENATRPLMKEIGLADKGMIITVRYKNCAGLISGALLCNTGAVQFLVRILQKIKGLPLVAMETSEERAEAGGIRSERDYARYCEGDVNMKPGVVCVLAELRQSLYYDQGHQIATSIRLCGICPISFAGGAEYFVVLKGVAWPSFVPSRCTRARYDASSLPLQEGPNIPCTEGCEGCGMALVGSRTAMTVAGGRWPERPSF
jgi:hypothetical protein